MPRSWNLQIVNIITIAHHNPSRALTPEVGHLNIYSIITYANTPSIESFDAKSLKFANRSLQIMHCWRAGWKANIFQPIYRLGCPENLDILIIWGNIWRIKAYNKVHTWFLSRSWICQCPCGCSSVVKIKYVHHFVLHWGRPVTQLKEHPRSQKYRRSANEINLQDR